MKNLGQKVLATLALASTAQPAFACGAEPYIGEICYYPFNFCPTGSVPADGKLYAISSYSAAFSLMGITYGGNGQTNFAVPDLRGRAAIGAGAGSGLSFVPLGEMGGSETSTLSTNNLPQGTAAATTSSTASAPASGTSPAYVVSPTGNGAPVNTRSPYLGVTVCIYLSGMFPSRP